MNPTYKRERLKTNSTEKIIPRRRYHFLCHKIVYNIQTHFRVCKRSHQLVKKSAKPSVKMKRNRKTNTNPSNVKSLTSNVTDVGNDSLQNSPLDCLSYDKHMFRCEGCDLIFKSNQDLAMHSKKCNQRSIGKEVKRDSQLQGFQKPKARGIGIKTPKHQCDHCAFLTGNKRDFEIHLWDVHSEKRHKCNQCGKAFKHAYILSKHTKIHAEARQFTCNKCDWISSSKEESMTHRRDHVGEKYEKYRNTCQCELCDFSHQTSANLKAHVRGVHCERQYHCDHCEFSGKSVSVFKRHLLTHQIEKPFVCDKCTYSTKYKCNLLSHQRVHVGDKPFKCDKCNFTAALASGLANHKMIHNDEKPYKCEHCDFETKTAPNLRNHVKRMHEGEVLACPDCDFTTRNASSLVNHKKRHHTIGLSLKCQQQECDFVAKSISELRNHVKTVHDSCKVKLYTCDECSFGTKAASSLRYHKERVHNKGNVYKCVNKNCQYGTHASINLQRHIKRVHDVTKDYRCIESGCSYTTSSACYLRDHVRRVHGPAQYKCHHFNCSFATKTASNLASHVSEVHSMKRTQFSFFDVFHQ